MELLNDSHINLLFLAVFHCLSKYHGVAACLSLSAMVAAYLLLFLRSHGVAACTLISQMLAGCLSLSLLIHVLSLTVSNSC